MQAGILVTGHMHILQVIPYLAVAIPALKMRINACTNVTTINNNHDKWVNQEAYPRNTFS